jgi:hypothetical protein
VESKRAVSVSDAWELRFSEPPLTSEVLVGKTKELNYGAVKSLSQLLGDRVDENRLAHDSAVGQEVRLMGRHQNDSFVIYLKRDSRITMKRSDMLSERFALGSDCVIRVYNASFDDSGQFLQILALISFHKSPEKRRRNKLWNVKSNIDVPISMISKPI